MPRSDFPTLRSFRRAVARSLVNYSEGPPEPARRAAFGALVWSYRAQVARAWLRGLSPDQAGAALAHEANLRDPENFSFVEVVHH